MVKGNANFAMAQENANTAMALADYRYIKPLKNGKMEIVKRINTIAYLVLSILFLISCSSRQKKDVPEIEGFHTFSCPTCEGTGIDSYFGFWGDVCTSCEGNGYIAQELLLPKNKTNERIAMVSKKHRMIIRKKLPNNKVYNVLHAVELVSLLWTPEI